MFRKRLAWSEFFAYSFKIAVFPSQKPPHYESRYLYNPVRFRIVRLCFRHHHPGRLFALLLALDPIGYDRGQGFGY